MGGAIYLIQDNDQLVEMTEDNYHYEDLLKKLLAQYPSLLAGDQINNAAPRRWLLVKPEAGVPSEEGGGDRWSVDHLFLDQDGVPTLIGIKRSVDTRIRREVVGQMLDCAANAVGFWPMERIRALFEAWHGEDTEKVLMEFLNSDPEILNPDPDFFWHRVKTNLQAGRIRLIFVADKIPSELQRIVEFLSSQMDPAEVLALEVKQYAGQGLKTLVPTVIGQTAAIEQKKFVQTREKEYWDEESFLRKLESSCSAEEVKITSKIIQWAKDKDLIIAWGKVKESVAFTPKVKHREGVRNLFFIWTFGKVTLLFNQMQGWEPFDDAKLRLELLQKIKKATGADITPDAIKLQPTFPLAILKDEDVLKNFLECFDWAIQLIRAT